MWLSSRCFLMAFEPCLTRRGNSELQLHGMHSSRALCVGTLQIQALLGSKWRRNYAARCRSKHTNEQRWYKRIKTPDCSHPEQHAHLLVGTGKRLSDAIAGGIIHQVQGKVVVKAFTTWPPRRQRRPACPS